MNEIHKRNKNNTVLKSIIYTTRLNLEDEVRFKRFCVCYYDILKKGWKEDCRTILGLDGCFLKTVCVGQLLSVVGRDENNHMMTESMRVVESEKQSKIIFTTFIK